MKGFIGIIGLLTIAQWLFIGLLYGFLEGQNKNSPETMAKLHDFPVIGGYFPKVTLQTKEEKERSYGDKLREMTVDARLQWNLPASFNEEEFAKLMEEFKDRGDRLKSESRKIEKLKLEVRTMVDEINRREKMVLSQTHKLTQRENQLIKSEEEIALKKQGQAATLERQQKEHNRKIARWLNTMSPEGARDRLMKGGENESVAEKIDRYRQAARLLALMDEEQAAQVIEILDPVDWVKIQEMKRSLPVDEN